MDGSSNPVVLLIMQSDLMTKLVLVVLLVLSVVAWGLFIYKLVISALKQRQIQKVLAALKKKQKFEEIRLIGQGFAHTMPGAFILQHIATVNSLLEGRHTLSPFSDREMAVLQGNLEQTLDDAIRSEESFIPFFAAAAAVSPLLGLFGTVWGLIHAFVKISEKQQADIPTVAPGIAEALITTLAGLMVAIPALMMFHYLTTRVRSLEHQLVKLSDSLSWSVNSLFNQ
jgi:biopolymer transport protein TolQ